MHSSNTPELSNESASSVDSVTFVNAALSHGGRDAQDATTERRLRRVLHIVNGEYFSGAERVQDLLANHLGPCGYDVGFVCVKPDRFPHCRSNNAPLYEMPMRYSLDRRLNRAVADLVRSEEYSIVHAHTPRSLLVACRVAMRCRVPLVYHVHSPVGRDSTRSFRNRINTWVESWCLRRADRLICVSNSLGEYMRGLGHSNQKIRVVHNGVPDDPTAQAKRSAPEVWTLGTMALFRPRKGTEVLLQAIAELRRRGHSLRLRAVGPFETDEYRAELRLLSERLGIEDSIEWTGFCSDVNEQLRQMDVFVLPSLFGEGLPMVVLEAMAQGVPVVASRVEGTPEAVRDGVDGRIFEPGNAIDLADKLEGLLRDPKAWSEYSRNALRRQRESLSAEMMAHKVAAVYDEIG